MADEKKLTKILITIDEGGHVSAETTEDSAKKLTAEEIAHNIEEIAESNKIAQTYQVAFEAGRAAAREEFIKLITDFNNSQKPVEPEATPETDGGLIK